MVCNFREHIDTISLGVLGLAEMSDQEVERTWPRASGHAAKVEEETRTARIPMAVGAHGTVALKQNAGYRNVPLLT
jgi:hypothetical protein